MPCLQVLALVALLGHAAALAPSRMSPDKAAVREKFEEARSAAAKVHSQLRFQKQALAKAEADERQREADEKAQEHARRSGGIQAARAATSDRLRQTVAEMHEALVEPQGPPQQAVSQDRLKEVLDEQRAKENAESDDRAAEAVDSPAVVTKAEAQKKAQEEARSKAELQQAKAALRAKEAEEQRRKVEETERARVAAARVHEESEEVVKENALKAESVVAAARQTATARGVADGPLEAESAKAIAEAEQKARNEVRAASAEDLDAAKAAQEAEVLREETSRAAKQKVPAAHPERARAVASELRGEAADLKGESEEARDAARRAEMNAKDAVVESVKQVEAQEMAEVDAARREDGKLRLSPQAAETSSPPISRALEARKPAAADAAVKKSELEHAAKLTMRAELRTEDKMQGKAAALKRQEETVQQRLRVAMGGRA